MKGAFLSLLALGALAIPAAAHAKDFGDAGTIEVGGTFGFRNDTTDLDKSGKTTTTDMTISPSIGYYVIPGLDVTFGVNIDNSTQKQSGNKDTSTTFTPNVGAGYFVPAGPVRVGPAVQLDLINQSDKPSGGTTVKRTGTGLGLGLLAKAPVGGGGLLTAGLVYEHDDVTDKAGGAKDKGKIDSFGTVIGFSVFF